MTLEQMRDVLATVAGYDGRTVDLRTIHDWQAILHSVPHELALQAVRAWYAENRGYVQPHDVAAYAARLAGLDKRRSITQMRLEGQVPDFEHQKLAPRWQIEHERKGKQDD